MRKLFFSFLLCLITASALVAQSPVPGSNAARIVTAGQVNGTWQYRGKYRNNIFKIWALGQQKLKVEFFGTYQQTPLGLNDGSGSSIARIDGDTAIFRPDDPYLDPDEPCKITMQFTKGKLIVKQEGVCGFGLNVGALGTYRRVSTAKPKFGEFAP